MNHTVTFAENPSVDLTEETVDPRPPDRIDFEAEGVIRPSEGLLSRFEGRSLNPVSVEISLGPSGTVAVDLEEEATLRLESIDVGVSTPDADDVASSATNVRRSGDDAPGADAPTGAIAFTVEGTIHDVPEATIKAIADESPGLTTVTFGVEKTATADGGAPADVLLDVSLFGYGLRVHRDGVIEVLGNGGGDDLGLL